MMRAIPGMILGVLLAATLAAQTTLQVPTTYATIQAAINAAQSGDVVEVLPGTYFENVVLADKDIELRAQTRGTVIIDGGGLAPCLKVERSFGCVVDGLELTNGYGGSQPFSNFNTYGGGLWLSGADYVTNTNPGAALLVKYCSIHGNQAEYGAGVYVSSGCTMAIEDSNVSANISNFTAGIYAENGLLRVDRTIVNGNGPGFGGIGSSLGSVSATDCSITNNTYGAISASGAQVNRCLISGNASIFASGASPNNLSVNTRFNDCLIFGNGDFSRQGALIRFPRAAILSNCTIVDNFATPGFTLMEALTWAQVKIDNCIIRDNGGPDFLVTPPSPTNPLITLYPPAAIICDHSCLSASNTSGPGNIAVDPLFVDPLFGDYRLQVGSPCVDAGDQTLASTSTADLTGGSRVLMADVDMGCFEARELGHHPASVGRVGLNANGPFDVLAVNGSFGGVDRRVTVGVGTSSVVTMATPPTGVTSANFVIFGLLGEATAETVVALPFGIGDMMFAPQPMVPAFLHWLFFTFTDNFNPGSPQFAPSTPTPWSSGLGPAIPFPLTLTLQGVVEESPGVFVTTNAVLFKVL